MTLRACHLLLEWILLCKAFYQMPEGNIFGDIFHLLLKKKYVHLKTSFKFTSKENYLLQDSSAFCEKRIVISL